MSTKLICDKCKRDINKFLVTNLVEVRFKRTDSLFSKVEKLDICSSCFRDLFDDDNDQI